MIFISILLCVCVFCVFIVVVVRPSSSVVRPSVVGVVLRRRPSSFVVVGPSSVRPSARGTPAPLALLDLPSSLGGPPQAPAEQAIENEEEVGPLHRGILEQGTVGKRSTNE